MELERLAPGVRGYTMEHGGALYVPLIVADRPGSGDVSRFLDGLPRDRTVKVPNVLNARLVGMLARRGFVPVREFAAEWDEWVEVWTREAGMR